MFIFVGVLLVICAIGGFVELILAFFGRVPTAQRSPQYLERKRLRIVRTFWTFAICTVGLVFLTSGFASPVGVLLIVSPLLALGYALALIDPKMLLRK